MRRIIVQERARFSSRYYYTHASAYLAAVETFAEKSATSGGAAGHVETIVFPREGPGVNYALNWAISSKGVVPQGDTYQNLKEKDLKKHTAAIPEPASPAKICAQGSYSVGAADISKAQFNGSFKEVTTHLSSAPKQLVAATLPRKHVPLSGYGSIGIPQHKATSSCWIGNDVRWSLGVSSSKRSISVVTSTPLGGLTTGSKEEELEECIINEDATKKCQVAVDLSIGKQVIQILQQLQRADDLQTKLAPFVGKISMRDATVIIKLIPDKRLVFHLYMWMKQQPQYSPNVFFLLAVVRNIVDTGKWQKLEIVVDELFAHNFVLDQKVFVRIIKTASDYGKVDLSIKWFQRMKDSGLQPDVIAYNTMIHAYAKAGMHSQAFSTFQDMQDHDVNPDVSTFGHLLNVCRRDGDVVKAKRIFQEMRQAGVQPNHVVYSIFLDIYGKKGEMEAAAATFKEMQEAGIMPDAKAYNSLIHGFAKAGMIDQATLAFHDLRRSGCEPDNKLFWTLLRMYAQARLWDEALAVKQLMQQCGVSFNTFCYDTLVTAFFGAQRLEDAILMFKEMQRSSVPIEPSTYIMMLKVYLQAGQHVECEKIFDLMMRKGFKQHVGAYEGLLELYHKTRRISHATQLYQQMQLNECVPTPSMFGMLLDLYTHAGMFPASELILQHMQSLGHKPDLATYTALVAAYMRYGHYSRASELCGRMKEAGLSVDTSLKAQIEAKERSTRMI